MADDFLYMGSCCSYVIPVYIFTSLRRCMGNVEPLLDHNGYRRLCTNDVFQDCDIRDPLNQAQDPVFREKCAGNESRHILQDHQ